jgi:hypothetical protein
VSHDSTAQTDGPACDCSADIPETEDANRLSAHLNTTYGRPATLRRCPLRAWNGARQCEDETDGELGHGIGVRTRCIGDHNAMICSRLKIDVADTYAIASNHAQPGSGHKDGSIDIVQAGDESIYVGELGT